MGGAVRRSQAYIRGRIKEVQNEKGLVFFFSTAPVNRALFQQPRLFFWGALDWGEKARKKRAADRGLKKGKRAQRRADRGPRKGETEPAKLERTQVRLLGPKKRRAKNVLEVVTRERRD